MTTRLKTVLTALGVGAAVLFVAILLAMIVFAGIIAWLMSWR